MDKEISSNQRIWRARPRWLDEQRKQLRWLDRRLALLHGEGTEMPGVTRDVSAGGFQLALLGAAPQPGEIVGVEVAFEEDILSAAGRVRYVMPTEWGSLVGVHCARDERRRRFIVERYARPLLAEPE